MESWLSWTFLWAIIGLWSFWWILGSVGVGFSLRGIVSRLFKWVPGLRASAPEDSNTDPPAGITRLSDRVRVLYEPAKGTKPEVDVVFIHGLQFCNFADAYWKTWTTVDRNGNEICWPQTWLGEQELPRARILSLSYDSSAIRTDKEGRLDPYATGESLLQEMVMLGGLGQHCPVVFVCHSLGGLIIKEVVIQANDKHRHEEIYKKFLDNIRGFHFYATPHDGSKLADLASALPLPFVEKGPMVKYLKVINDNLGRLKGDFERITREEFRNKWKFSVVAEKNATRMGDFYALVVPDASARFGGYPFLPVSLDHFQVCKPKDKDASVFKVLVKFIVEDIMSKTVTTGEQARQELQGIL